MERKNNAYCHRLFYDKLVARCGWSQRFLSDQEVLRLEKLEKQHEKLTV